MEEKQMLNIMSDIIDMYDVLLKDEDVLTNDSFDYTLGYLIRKNYDKEFKKHIMDSEKELVIKNAIAELYALNIPEAEYKYETVDGCWIDIKHNISDLISVDDEVAYKTGEVLKKCLIDKGITHFSFYQED